MSFRDDQPDLYIEKLEEGEILNKIVRLMVGPPPEWQVHDFVIHDRFIKLISRVEAQLYWDNCVIRHFRFQLEGMLITVDEQEIYNEYWRRHRKNATGVEHTCWHGAVNKYLLLHWTIDIADPDIIKREQDRFYELAMQEALDYEDAMAEIMNR